MENLNYTQRVKNLFEKFDKEKAENILNILTNIQTTNPNISLSAIIDKLIEPDISYLDISAFTYINAVKMWNSHIVQTQNEQTLLIDTKHLVC